jgi:uncharacterized protein
MVNLAGQKCSIVYKGHPMKDPTDLSLPLTDEEYEELDAFLLAQENDDGIVCVSELDGFITAVVSGPEAIPPSQWLPVIWGGEDQSPDWQSEQEFQHIFSLLIRHMNSTAATLMEAPMEFGPCFLEHVEGDQQYLIVDEWCEGYMKAVALHPERWAEMPLAFDDFLAPMLMFTTDEGFAQLEEMEQQEVEFWQHQIEPAARRIHLYWLEQRAGGAPPQYHPTLLPTSAANDEPFVRGAPKTGRNDPCPCGSGKKYKLCCGLH